jgi:hypothetical protein
VRYYFTSKRVPVINQTIPNVYKEQEKRGLSDIDGRSIKCCDHLENNLAVSQKVKYKKLWCEPAILHLDIYLRCKKVCVHTGMVWI